MIVIIGRECDIDVVKKSLRSDVEYEVIIWDTYIDISRLEGSVENFNYIIVAEKNEKIEDEIVSFLRKILSIGAEKIIGFYKSCKEMLPYSKVERILDNPDNDYFEGLVLGISHGQVGIIAERLGKWANLAVSHQDLYYNYQALKYCYDNYYEKISKLKYLIIDMWDYNYFNYDTSLSSNMYNYILRHGYVEDEHNFHYNKNYEESFDFLKRKAVLEEFGETNETIQKKKVIMEKVFDINYYKFNSDKIEERNRITDEFDLQINGQIFYKTFENTISENIVNLARIFHVSRLINPEIKISLLLIPRYEGARLAIVHNSGELHSLWKDTFYKIIDNLKQKYEFEFWDFSEHEISKNKNLYFDLSHLNFWGAIKFTDMIKNIILDLPEEIKEKISH